MQLRPETGFSLIETANAHLNHVAAVAEYSVNEGTLRVASSSLRFLLVDDMLGQAWRAAGFGGPMTFKAWCITSTNGTDVIAYCGGGDLLPGVPFSVSRNAKLEELTLDLNSFRKRTRIQVGSTEISTVQLIQYVSNTLGGTHFDPEGKSPKSQRPTFNLLRKLEAGDPGFFISHINGRNLLHHELLCKRCFGTLWVSA